MRLIERVAFDSPEGSGDGFGGKAIGWNEEFTTRANFVFLRGGEKVLAGRLSGSRSAIITVRKSSRTDIVKGTWSIRDLSNDSRFVVRSIEPNREKPRQYVDILCEHTHEG